MVKPVQKKRYTGLYRWESNVKIMVCHQKKKKKGSLFDWEGRGNKK